MLAGIRCLDLDKTDDTRVKIIFNIYGKPRTSDYIDCLDCTRSQEMDNMPLMGHCLFRMNGQSSWWFRLDCVVSSAVLGWDVVSFIWARLLTNALSTLGAAAEDKTVITKDLVLAAFRLPACLLVLRP